MEQYVGTKLIQAEPAKRVKLRDKSDKGFCHEVWEIGREANDEAGEKILEQQIGYKVVYEGGYESFSPKVVFEKAYFKVEENVLDLIEDAVRHYQPLMPEVTTEHLKSLVGEGMKLGLDMAKRNQLIYGSNIDLESTAQLMSVEDHRQYRVEVYQLLHHTRPVEGFVGLNGPKTVTTSNNHIDTIFVDILVDEEDTASTIHLKIIDQVGKKLDLGVDINTITTEITRL